MLTPQLTPQGLKAGIVSLHVTPGEEDLSNKEIEFSIPVHEQVVIGEIYFDQYRIISEIGSGGMGRVFKAQHSLLNNVVALKILHRNLTGESEHLKRFQIEAQAASKLRHENLVTVTDYGITRGDQPYLVMDYLEGESLAELLNKHRRLSVSEFLEVFTQVARGLAHAHEKGIVHRDLKPSNIMISRDADGRLKAKIIDFGIAKILAQAELPAENVTQAGAIFGSPLYMSPEQCRGVTIDPRADIYSLGCVMFESLTGEVPIKGPTTIETLFLHMTGTSTSISRDYPQLDIPSLLSNIVSTAMAHDCADRYQNAGELAKVFNEIQLEELTAPTRAGFAQRVAAKVPGVWEMRRLLALLASLVLAVLLSVIVLTTRQNTDHNLSGWQINTASKEDIRKQLEQADLYCFAAQNRVRNVIVSPDYAEKALEIRKRLAPNTPALAESYAQVAWCTFSQGIKEHNSTLTKKGAELYEKAIKIMPQEYKSLYEGRPKYMHDLATFYLQDKQFDKAEKTLDDICKGACITVENLYDNGHFSGLLIDYANLYWGQKRYLESAKCAIKSSVRAVKPEDMSDKANHSFSGKWLLHYFIPQDYQGSLTIRPSINANKTTADLSCTNYNPTKVVTLDHNAIVDTTGSLGTIRWADDSGSHSAYLVRLGKFLYMRRDDSNESSARDGMPQAGVFTLQKM